MEDANLERREMVGSGVEVGIGWRCTPQEAHILEIGEMTMNE